MQRRWRARAGAAAGATAAPCAASRRIPTDPPPAFPPSPLRRATSLSPPAARVRRAAELAVPPPCRGHRCRRSCRHPPPPPPPRQPQPPARPPAPHLTRTPCRLLEVRHQDGRHLPHPQQPDEGWVHHRLVGECPPPPTRQRYRLGGAGWGARVPARAPARAPGPRRAPGRHPASSAAPSSTGGRLPREIRPRSGISRPNRRARLRAPACSRACARAHPPSWRPTPNQPGSPSFASALADRERAVWLRHRAVQPGARRRLPAHPGQAGHRRRQERLLQR